MTAKSCYETFTKLFEAANLLLSRIAGLLIVFCMISIVADVIGRYFLGKPIIWVFYYSEYILVYSTFLAASYVLQRDGHVKVDLVIALLNDRWRAYASVVSSLIGLFVSIVIGWYSLIEAFDTLRQKTMFTAPVAMYQFPIKIIVPFGFLLLCLEWIRKILTTVYLLSKKEFMIPFHSKK